MPDDDQIHSHVRVVHAPDGTAHVQVFGASHVVEGSTHVIDVPADLAEYVIRRVHAAQAELAAAT